ncbi:unnamed protein product [Rhizophagus irregularis]|nr:unnamed protein product [Rhizophagus irregularis]
MYLEETMGILCWRDIVDMLWSISAGLNFIHGHGLVHGNLHGGNILVDFGMIMWMLSAGVRPYYDRPHDKQLIKEICSGLRPSIVNGTPAVYSRLMFQCLDVNPLNRPAASQLHECFGNWISEICDSPDPSDLSNQFDAAEEIKFSNLKNFDFNIAQCHEMAIYCSRPLLDHA